MVKVGIIGAGRIGRVHITSISTRVKDAVDRKSTRLNSSHTQKSRMPSSA